MNMPVTFSAARRRFARKVNHSQGICKLKPRERGNLKATYGLVRGNLIIDHGDLDSVDRWCREAGVLQEQEIVVD